ncbi:MAG: hypothetical protein LBL90_12360 [Prevotellaceae bacterium]|jgi:hypothetical protein|nr:hypothetical protein [Prevotellaceae bacterium]
MKKPIILAITFFALLCFSNKAEAIPVFYSFGGEKLNTMYDLPNDSTTMSADGYVNIGCKFKQFSIFWIPIWNWDEQYCFVVEGKNNTYYSATTQQIKELANEYNVKLAGASPSFWNKIGGKIIVCILLALIIWGYIPGKKKKDDEVTATDTM